MSVGAYVLSGGDKEKTKNASLAYNLSGMRGADAAEDAANEQKAAAAQAIGFQRETRDLARADLQPFRAFGQGNLGPLGEMLTPQGQMSYLQQNPLFQFSMDNLNRQSNNTFLGRGKLGDASNQLVKNAFLAGAPLLQQQTSNLFNAVNLGQASAAGQANTSQNAGQSITDLITGAANAGAAGTIGAANAGQQGASNAVGIIGALGSLFSDRRLKRNITRHGKHGPYNTYKYQYKWADDWFIGVMSDEVRMINPAAVSVDKSGYDVVDYGAL